MIFKSIASSSHGNAYTVTDGKSHILLECGLSHKKILQGVGRSLSDFSACLVSHEHKDHAKSVPQLLERGMDVYMSEGTAAALDVEDVHIISHMEQFSIGTFDIMPFSVFHDAAEPLGFLIRSREDGESLAFATDTVNLRYRFPGINILAIEANYDKNILDLCEKLPDKVRHRITNAHMEIVTLCNYLKSLDLSSCREIYLLHLSDATSHEEEFIKKVRSVIPPGVIVRACRKEG